MNDPAMLSYGQVQMGLLLFSIVLASAAATVLALVTLFRAADHAAKLRGIVDDGARLRDPRPGDPQSVLVSELRTELDALRRERSGDREALVDALEGATAAKRAVLDGVGDFLTGAGATQTRSEVGLHTRPQLWIPDPASESQETPTERPGVVFGFTSPPKFWPAKPDYPSGEPGQTSEEGPRGPVGPVYPAGWRKLGRGRRGEDYWVAARRDADHSCVLGASALGFDAAERDAAWRAAAVSLGQGSWEQVEDPDDDPDERAEADDIYPEGWSEVSATVDSSDAARTATVVVDSRGGLRVVGSVRGRTEAAGDDLLARARADALQVIWSCEPRRPDSPAEEPAPTEPSGYAVPEGALPSGWRGFSYARIGEAYRVTIVRSRDGLPITGVSSMSWELATADAVAYAAAAEGQPR